MKVGRRIRQGGFIAFALFAGAGCSYNTAFVYKPGPAAQGAVGLPAKVAVLPFQDGTPNYTKRGTIFAANPLSYNLAKAGADMEIDALTPPLWAKSFAEELAASGAFRSVRYVYSPSELLDEDFYVEGTVLKAEYSAGALTDEFALAFHAFRRADRRPVWEKQVIRSRQRAPEIFKGCGGVWNQCWVDAVHAEMNRIMRGMFTEAGEDFVATLTAQSGGGGSVSGKPPSAGEKQVTAPAPEPVDATIDKILKGS